MATYVTSFKPVDLSAMERLREQVSSCAPKHYRGLQFPTSFTTDM
jgi:hypothetical protein